MSEKIIRLVALKSVNLDDPNATVKTMNLTQTEFDIHTKIKTEWLKDYAVIEGDEDMLEVKTKSNKIEPTIEVPLEIEDIPEDEAFDPFLPHADVKLQGEDEALSIDTFVYNSEPKESFNKPKKQKKQKIKAH